MEQVTSAVKNDRLVVYVSGRVDTSNAPAVQDAIDEEIAKAPDLPIELDADNLVYISSSGLRVLLRLRKAHADFEITNVSPEVYEVLEMTGFTEMLPIKKAYRKLSVDGCEAIGTGANGLVYRLDPETIIKVYRNPDCLPDIQRERELAKRAFVLGIPTAIPYDVVRVGDSYGSVFELLNALSLVKLVNKDPDNIEKYIHQSVDLLKIIHSTDVQPDDMPDMKAVVVNWVEFLKDYLEPTAYEKLRKLVEAVPDSNRMMHGDYHMKNVMVQNGEALLIDMDTLAHGDPVFEFASIFNAYMGFSAMDPEADRDMLGLSAKAAITIWEKTKEYYFGTDPAVLEEVENKSELIGYTRLMRRLIRRKGLETDEGRRTIAFYKEQIEKLVDKVDTLSLAQD